ncbi:membrane protein required for colicin V production [Extensimonas vulgaris]|jgi:membrane protein required for colicin V production|uniref:Membrane protein required for colicin V production n=2 Tax=Extensimonas vulgaris TaxID=1031594 RepID=A0A369AQF6_9BURK|nr:membrane protein required for colicin V production [Extensimonas vulgaris]TWI40504.1 membrane protein required for colicin V production [Extensimonas vulgaris]
MMAALDWLCLAVLLVSMLLGTLRGLVFEMLSVLGWVFAFWLAQRFSADVALFLPFAEIPNSVRHAVGFVLVLVVAVFASGFVAWGMQKLVHATGLRPADRLLGAAFGALRGVVLLLVLALLAAWTPVHEAHWWRASYSAPLLSSMLSQVKPVLPSDWGRQLPS